MTSDWLTTNRWTVVDRDEYTAEMEEIRNGDQTMHFAHIDVRVWSREVLIRLRDEFAVFRDLMDVPLFATSPTSNDPKWQSFVKLFGFRPLVDAGNCQIYVSYKDKNNGRQRRSVATEHRDEPVGSAP